MYSISGVIRIGLLSLVAALGLAACDNPVEEEDHPVGLVILNAQGQQVARFVVGTEVTGELAVPLGTAAIFRVGALAENGQLLEIDGEELSLQAAVTAGGASVAVQSADRLVLTGTQAGAGKVQLTLEHERHPEFAADFPFVVSP